MQAITHFLCGLALKNIVPYWLAIILSCLSHIPLDLLARSTYHPPNPHFDDEFWITSHAIFYGGGIVIFVLFQADWIIMLSSVLIDLYDWVLIRPLSWMYPYFGHHILHRELHRFRDKLFFLPDLSEKPIGIFVELCLIIFLLGLIIQSHLYKFSSTIFKI